MLFNEDNFDINVSFVEMPDFLIKEKKCILSPVEGFLKGNMFADQYESYKNYSIEKLCPKSDKEKLLFNIMALDFAINDLNLYLDLNNDDEYVFNLFKKYIYEKEKLEKEYEKLYGPLSLDDTIGCQYDWLNNWPWEKSGGDLYV